MDEELLLDGNGLLTIKTFLHLGGISRCLIFGNGICEKMNTYDILPCEIGSKTIARITNINTGKRIENHFSRPNSARHWLTRKYWEINNPLKTISTSKNHNYENIFRSTRRKAI